MRYFVTPLENATIQRTVTVKKAKVSVKAKKVVEYKGFKIKLKATVKSNGKNVNEGKVQFKINVRNTLSTLKMVLPLKSLN